MLIGSALLKINQYGGFVDHLLNEEERYLSAHISDLAELSRRTGVPRFSRFLNERERSVAAAAARANNADPIFYGGYDGAARTLCGFFEGTYAEELPKEELFPLCAVTFSFKKSEGLSHRDFLGAILGLGLERSAVGDILVAEDYAIVFCTDTATPLVTDIVKVGRSGVSTEKGITKEIPEPKLEALDRTVSSLRLDCMVGACANISRDRSASLIKSGQVCADHLTCLNVSSGVKEGEIISIRGFGRFKVSKIVGETKKGRIRVIIEKFV